VVVRLRGQLEQDRPAGVLRLRDATGAITLKPTAAPPKAMVGGVVETLAFCRPSGEGWTLEAGFFRTTPSNAPSSELPLPLLKTAEEILRLKPAEAKLGRPVRLQGVITCLWPNYHDNAILQDTTRGVFMKLPKSAARQGLQIGDFWEVEGTTARGDFAPIVNVTNLTRISEARMPEPIRPSWEQLINGSLDAQYVEIEGIITKVNGDVATLLTHWGNIDVSVTGLGPLSLGQFENYLVRLRGCLLAAWDENSGLIRVGELRLAAATVSTEETMAPDPFAAPMKSLDDLLRFDLQASGFQRVRLGGQIVLRRGNEFFLSTPGGGCRLVSRNNDGIVAGDLVDVAGFPKLEGPSPVLREAVMRKTGSAELPPPRRIGIGNMFNADNDSLRVFCEGTLVSERRGPGGLTLLELQSGLRQFVVRTTSKSVALPRLLPGSQLEIVGVYAGQSGARTASRKVDSFELLVDSPSAVRVMALPPWWNLRRLVSVLAVLVVMLAAVMLWVFQLRRRVEAQTVIIRQKVEREATIEERSRIARELHDTLEQALAGVSFQLGALAGLMRGLPEGTLEALNRARLMVRHGQ
jgi:hypothetical protein